MAGESGRLGDGANPSSHDVGGGEEGSGDVELEGERDHISFPFRDGPMSLLQIVFALSPVPLKRKM